jgi:hypothetical protein
MTRCLRFALVSILLLALITSVPRSILACGPFTLEAIFVFSVHPEYPLSEFARGELGIIHSTYARSYLVVAYRHLSGAGFNQNEQKALADFWKERIDFTWELGEQQWIEKWNAARAKVPDFNSPAKIDVYRNREKPNEYETFLNCQKDAFSTATQTLEEKIKKLGADNSEVKQWLEAQDQVFANCSEGKHIPPALGPDSQGRADRDYQIAAASFYAGDFDAARKAFSSIAADANSPWRDRAPYLEARALVRKASLGSPDEKKASLTAAEEQLKKILSDRKLATQHAAAEKLMSVVQLRLRPESRLNELARSLLARNRDANLRQDLWDYTFLLDQFFGEAEADKKDNPSPAILAEDLTDWITTFSEIGRTEAVNHSIEKWQETGSLPWLVAALSKIDNGNEKTGELVAHALKVAIDSPAYPTVLYHVVRLDIQAGRNDQARSRLDETLAKHRASLNRSTLNVLLNLRMALASNLEDFLTYAQQEPAGLSWNDDGREVPAQGDDLQEEKRSLQGQKFFDHDGAQTLNQRIPVTLLKQAAQSKVLPANLRRDVSQAAWLRAVLLGDYRTADQLTPTLNELVPTIAPLLEGFTSASQPDAKKFAALYAWLKFPGLEPVVDLGIGRETPLGQQDVYRDNWWCGSAFTSTPSETNENQDKPQPPPVIDPSRFPVFLTRAQRATAAKEYSTLTALGPAPNYLCREVVQWGTANPDDPRVPEALHLAVKSTRYGCSNKDTGRWSKAAFDLLHKRYPASSWAKQTPYWFKD